MSKISSTLAEARARRLRVDGASEYLDVSKSTLAHWRSSGTGPKYIKLGGRVFYEVRDLDAHIDACRIQSTAANRRAP